MNKLQTVLALAGASDFGMQNYNSGTLFSVNIPTKIREKDPDNELDINLISKAEAKRQRRLERNRRSAG